ncbi:cation diffusion facilitator family transporter [Ruegeria sp. SCP11]|uniref:cation diffusion facilitator family transporter n=1 Tax=Ruegeria sp. SCP11 TaxID=3141378 RepID=UPI00333DB52B
MSTHEHSGHAHSHLPRNEKKIALAAGLTGLFMFIEMIGGVISGSLALIADAGHMLTDFGSLLLAWIAFRLSRRPADNKRSYGFDRFPVLAAFVNGLALFVIAIWISWEAWQRLSAPKEVLGGIMLWVALTGLIVNIIVFLILTRGGGENLNVRAAILHVAGDMLGSVAALIASLVIIFTGWTPIDPILSVFVSLIILKAAATVVMDSAHILLEGTPAEFDSKQVAKQLQSEIPDVVSVGHVHAWLLTQERKIATLEVTIAQGADAPLIKALVKQWLKAHCDIGHVTVEMRLENPEPSTASTNSKRLVGPI